jgi:hypothetical protein
MKSIKFILVLLVIIGLSACQKKEEPKAPASNLPSGTHAVKVLDFINVPNYTYLQVSENGNEYWLAAPTTKVEKGETVYYTQGMEMKNFHSQTINKTFDSIFFVQGITTSPQKEAITEAHQQAYTNSKEQISVQPLKDGKTVAQIFSDKSSLAGKTVRIRGKVTKYNPNIMGRNWIHIQDGTGAGNSYDLLVTSNDEAKVGQTVVIQGKVAIDKDFGAGYTYPVMIENAKVQAETK